MADEFVQYTRQGIAASTEGNMIRMWGEFGEYGSDEVHPTGISYHYPDTWKELTPGEDEQPRVAKLETLATIAAAADIPLIWFGEHNISWREGTGTVEIGELSYNGDGTFDADLEIVDITNLESKIQNLLGTSLDVTGAYKPENQTINSFQAYTREYLPTAYVIQDFDLLVESNPGEPAAIIEIKRTRKDPASWTPYANDWPNYYLQISLAEAAKVEPLLINHKKEFVDNEKVGFYYNLERPDNPNTDFDEKFLNWDKKIISASEARENLRNIDFYQ